MEKEKDQRHKRKQLQSFGYALFVAWLDVRVGREGGASAGGDVVLAPWCSGWGKMEGGITTVLPAITTMDTERREESSIGLVLITSRQECNTGLGILLSLVWLGS